MSAELSACRSCDAPLQDIFCDLGSSPLANSYVPPNRLDQEEPRFPLTAYVCTRCWLVQLPAHEKPDSIFTDYAYFTSYSSTALAHAAEYSELLRQRLKLDANSHVVEVASNDGYLLRNFKNMGIPVTGIEPASNVADAARAQGILTESFFLGAETANAFVNRHQPADLLIANNVLAHVPDINDFSRGLSTCLAPTGVCTIEFPHLLNLLEKQQFDTIYHEHYSYLSLIAVTPVLESAGLRVFDLDQLPTHGGSLRLYVCHQKNTRHETLACVSELRQLEHAHGLDSATTLTQFHMRVGEARAAIRQLITDMQSLGKVIAGYGAPAKAATLTNSCSVTARDCLYTVDANPEKQGRYIPGSRIPIHAPEHLAQVRPDVILIFAWNIAEEIMATLNAWVDWPCDYYVLIPSPRRIGRSAQQPDAAENRNPNPTGN